LNDAEPMVRTAFAVIVADIFLLTGEYYVNQDLQWRAAYAASVHNACGVLCSYTPSFSYSLLTQFFTMSGGRLTLVSPPTLDWVQALVLALVVINGWFAYHALKERGKRLSMNSQPKTPQ
jgi:hypothetical protein